MWPFDTVLFAEGILPFLLVFVLVFAVLQKTKVLGEGKNQIDALIALAVGLILIAVPVARDFIVNIMPWLAVGLVVILIFLMLSGFVGSDNKEGLKLGKGVKNTFLGLAALFVVALVVYFSGLWDLLFDGGADYGSWLPSVVMLVIIVAAVVVAIGGKKGKSGSTT
jgi:peptidoglycan/LPS O-acetylase OafA/YrhL